MTRSATSKPSPRSPSNTCTGQRRTTKPTQKIEEVMALAVTGWLQEGNAAAGPTSNSPSNCGPLAP
jgi:hypothetical protein